MNQEPINRQLGVWAALGAFVLWGIAPIYFKWVQEVPATEIIVHRIVFSIPVLAAFLLFRDGPGFWRRLILPRRSMAILVVSGTLIGANWLIFIWAVNHDQILATSLGYFIGPLVNVLLGMIFLNERLTRFQTVAVLIAAAGTAYFTWFLGVTPWISFFLAGTFGLYALVRKMLDVGPMVGLLWEAILLLLPAMAYVIWSLSHGGLMFLHGSTELDMLIIGLGIVTVLPLLFFNVAARHLDLSVIGFFQYLAPTITFALAVFVYGETFTQGHAVAFACIWIALALISFETIKQSINKKN